MVRKDLPFVTIIGIFVMLLNIGSYLHPHVQALRDFRDKYLLTK